MGNAKDLNKGAIVLSLAILVLNGCAMLPGNATRNDEVNRFKGKSESDLIGKYGQPVDVQAHGKGGKMLVFEWRYDETIQEPARVYTDSRGRVTSATGGYERTEHHLERRIFTLDRNGIIIDGKWKSY